MKTISSMLKNIGGGYESTVSDVADTGNTGILNELGIPGKKNGRENKKEGNSRV